MADVAKQVFVVVATSNPGAIAKEIKARGLTCYDIKSYAWLVTYNGTARELAELIKVRSVPYVGAALVFPIAGYSGRGEAALWEWLKVNWPQNG